MRKLKENLLLIGGSGRNVGKTTLALEIIKRFSSHERLLGLKVSTMRNTEENFHGDHQFPSLETGFLIQQEDLKFKHKDTARMVIEGAERAYYIQTAGDSVLSAYDEFENIYNPDFLPVVCESRSLIHFVKPGLFLMVVDMDNLKNDSNAIMKYADRIIYYKNNDLSNLIDMTKEVTLTNAGWGLNKT